MKAMSVGGLSLAIAVLAGMAAAPAIAQKATSPYQLSVFATAPKGLSAPDSIAVLHDHVFVGYGDGHAPIGRNHHVVHGELRDQAEQKTAGQIHE